MSQTFHFRKALPADALRLSILLQQVYIQTYGTEGVSAAFAGFISQRFSVAYLEAAIREEPDSLLVAEYRGNMVGAAEILYGRQSPVGDIVAPELSKLYVLEWFTGKGVGYGLLQAAEALVRTKGFDTMWLWVYVRNSRAIAFYKRQQYRWLGNAFFQMDENAYENEVLVKHLVAPETGYEPEILQTDLNPKR